MFDREMMIQGLRKQRYLLENLIVEIEQRPALDLEMVLLTNDRARQVSRNLFKLRRIKDNYLNFQKSSDS